MYQFPEHMAAKQMTSVLPGLNFPYTSVVTIVNMDLKDGSSFRKKKKLHLSVT